MALTFSLVDTWDDGQRIHVAGTAAGSGSYSTGGDTLDFTTVASRIGASQPPVQVWAGGTTGDNYGWFPGTALNNGKIKISTTSATELAAGAYPARITGDVNIQFEAAFRKLL